MCRGSDARRPAAFAYFDFAAKPGTKLGGVRALVFLISLFLVTLSFAATELPKLDVFIPLIATVMFIIDSITAALLFAQFFVLRSRALLVLASGYLFTALTIVPYALTFPGAFAPAGLLGGGRQAPPWFNTLWHIGLPAAIIAYALLSSHGRGVRLQARTAIIISISGVIILVSARDCEWKIIVGMAKA